VKFTLIATFASLLSGQSVPAPYQFAGLKARPETHSLRKPIADPAIAAIPAADGEAYVFEGFTGKLYRLRYAAFDMTEIPVTTTLEGGRVYSMAVDRDGLLYLPDPRSGRVLRIAPDGQAAVLTSGLDRPHSTAIDPSGNVFIADTSSIRRVDLQGRISHFAGASRAISPRGIATDKRGNLYVTTNGLEQLVVLNPAGERVGIRQIQDPALPGVPAPVAPAQQGLLAAVQPARDGSIYVADTQRHVIWKVGTNGYWSVAIGRAVTATDRFGSYVPGDYYGNGPLTGSEHFNAPVSLSMDASGRLLIADDGNVAVRLYTPGESLVTVAGNNRCCYQEEQIPANEATIEWPRGLAADTKGNVFLADPRSGRVRKIDAAGRISTVLGNGSLEARSGVPATGTGAQPYAVAVDSKGNLYVSEPGLKMVRRVTADGFVESIAGPASGTFPLDLITHPGSEALAVGADDALYYLAECTVNRWFAGKIDVVLANACVTTADGNVQKPVGIAVSPSGEIYLSTGTYQNIRVFRDGSMLRTFDVFPFGNQGFPYSLHFGGDGLLYVTDHFESELFGYYHLAYALTASGQQLEISSTYALPVFDGARLVGSISKAEPFPTTALMGITVDSNGRVIAGQKQPPGLLVFSKPRGAN